jgi:hypothetical protein
VQNAYNSLGGGCRGWVRISNGSLHDSFFSQLGILQTNNQNLCQVATTCNDEMNKGSTDLNYFNGLLAQANGYVSAFNSAVSQESANIGQYNSICSTARQVVIIAGLVAAAAVTIWAIAAAAPAAAVGTTATAGSTAGTTTSTAVVYSTTTTNVAVGSNATITSTALGGQFTVRVVAQQGATYLIQMANPANPAGPGVGPTIWAYLLAL